jgi:hypothetical protein
MKMVEMAVLEDFVLGDRFLNGFAVKMANWVFDPRRRLNYMMFIAIFIHCLKFVNFEYFLNLI